MNKASKYVTELSKLISEFKAHWESEEAYSNFGEESTIHGVFLEFSHLVIRKLKNRTLEKPENLFSYVEKVVQLGGEEAEAACTCFLENILNVTPSKIDPESFVQYLGNESKEYCKSYRN